MSEEPKLTEEEWRRYCDALGIPYDPVPYCSLPHPRQKRED